jgi:hypothetical protein
MGIEIRFWGVRGSVPAPGPGTARIGGNTSCVEVRCGAHRIVLDAARERKPPFNPSGVVEEFADLLHAYRVSRVKGDRYAGEWPREQFRKQGIGYDPAEADRSTLYLEMMLALNAGRVELLEDRRLVQQIAGLERRTSRLRFHAFFLTVGALAGITQVVATGLLGPGTAVLGASGAVFGLIGYLLAGNVVASTLLDRVKLPPRAQFALFALAALVVTIATGRPGVALVAHFTGLFLGLLAGAVGLLDT